jgi:hypothetical protein
LDRGDPADDRIIGNKAIARRAAAIRKVTVAGHALVRDINRIEYSAWFAVMKLKVSAMSRRFVQTKPRPLTAYFVHSLAT